MFGWRGTGQVHRAQRGSGQGLRSGLPGGRGPGSPGEASSSPFHASTQPSPPRGLPASRLPTGSSLRPGDRAGHSSGQGRGGEEGVPEPAHLSQPGSTDSGFSGEPHFPRLPPRTQRRGQRGDSTLRRAWPFLAALSFAPHCLEEAPQAPPHLGDPVRGGAESPLSALAAEAPW